MEKVKSNINTKALFNNLVDQSSDDWNELCAACTTLVKEAMMSDEDIDKIIEKAKQSCENSSMSAFEHFPDAGEMFKLAL